MKKKDELHKNKTGAQDTNNIDKQAEKSQLEDAEKYQNILKNVHDGCFELDLAGNFTFFNDSACRILGYSREELMGMNYRRYTDKENAKKVSEAYLKVYNTGEPSKGFNWEVTRKDGAKRYIETSVSLQKDLSGKPTGLIGVVNDITERKLAEETLKTSEERFRTAAENLTDVVYDWDIKEKVDWYGDIDGVMGYPPGGFPRTIKAWAATIHPEDKDRVMAALEDHVKGVAPFVIEYRVGRMDGEYRWWSARGTALRDDRGEPYKMIGSITDITERRRADEKRKESEKKYRLLADNVLDVIFVLDMNLKYTYVSPSVKILRGYEPEDVLKQSYTDILTSSSWDLVVKTLSDVMELEKTKQIELNESRTIPLEMKRKDGTTVWTEVKFSFIRDKDQRPVGILGVTRDITERKKQEEEMLRTKTLLNSIIENIPDMIFLKDAKEFRFISFNRAGEDLLGYSREEMLEKNDYDFFPREQADLFTKKNREVLRGMKIMDIAEETIQTRNKGERILHTQKVPIMNANGEPEYLLGISEDITERKQAEEALLKSEERYRTLVENASDIVFKTDDTGHFTFVNPVTLRITGYSEGEIIGKHYKMLVRPDKFKEVITLFESQYENRVQNTYHEFPIITKDGHEIWFGQNTQLLVKDDHVSGFQAVARDITERRRMEGEIQYQGTHDILTGLSNRLMFSQLLNHAIQSAKRYQRQFAVLFIDLDRFKIINDTMGHDAGDQLLQAIAARLKQTLRAADVVARMGGDEFVILIEEVTDSSHAATVAHKIINSIIKPITIMGQECRITASIGISIYPKDAEDEQSLMKNADMAMYLAKEEGKNNYQFYSKDIQSKSLERLSIETHLRFALERNELSLHYQAKVDFKTNMIKGVEALLRWQNPYLGSITPTQFIPVAEESGLIIPIGRWVFKTACAQNVAWQQQGLPAVCMAVNLSPRQLTDENLIDDIRSALNDSGMAPNLLEMEITESMVMHNLKLMIAVLAKIKELGVRLAIDDFGTGYSSLAKIKQFPIDTLKVDRSFIRNLPQDAGDRAITKAIIAMGKTLSLTVVAEGVETVEQMNFLKEHSCDEMQGYYFSKPIVPEQFADLLRKHVPFTRSESE